MPEGPEGQPEGPKGLLEGPKGLAGGAGGNGHRNCQIFSPFFRTPSPVGTAAQKVSAYKTKIGAFPNQTIHSNLTGCCGSRRGDGMRSTVFSLLRFILKPVVKRHHEVSGSLALLGG